MVEPRTARSKMRSAGAAALLLIFALPLPARAQQPPLVASPSPVSSTTPRQPAPEDSTTSLLRSLAVAGFVIGAVGVTLGTITGGLSFAKTAELADACDGDDVCPAEQQDTIDDAQLLSNLSNLGFITGGIGLAMGLTALLSVDSEKDNGSSRAVRVVPLLDPTTVGLSVSIPLL